MEADAYLAACDVPGIQRLIPPAWRQWPLFDNLYKLEAVPVATVQLRYDGWVTELGDGAPQEAARRDLAHPSGLNNLLYTADADLYFHADNGRGVREMVVENPLPPGNALLIPGTAHFSRSWAVQTEALGRSMVRTPWQSGWPPSWPSTAA